MTLKFSRTCFFICLLGSIIFSFFRFLQFYSYAGPDLIHLHYHDLGQAFLLGARFDLKITAIICLAIWLPLCLIGSKISSPRLKWNIQKTILFMIFFILIFMAAAQYYFYGFYKTPFNPLVFGLMEDDTTGILLSVWDTYPIFRIFLSIGSVSAGLVFLVKKGAHSPKNRKNILSGFACLIILGGLARGSLGVFPLRLQNATVSTHPFINDLVGNAFQTLYEAYQTHKEQATISSNAASDLKRFGFSSLDELAKNLGAASGSEKDLVNFIHHKTPHSHFLETHPPHVIFVLMESWGAHQLRFSSTQTNVTGELGKYLEKDHYFNNFFSSQIGTHSSLESLLINTPITPLTLGKYAFIDYHSAAAKPFKEKGYKTIFIYGGSNGWRELYKAIPHLSFDEMYDMANIQEKYPEAEGHVWGIYDEYLLRFAYDILQGCDQRGEKVMLFILNTTNHPPYTMPATYKPLLLDIQEMNKIAVNDPDVTYKMALTYQYANHHLGLFIDKIRQSSLGARSIISAAGDHSTRTFFKYNQRETKDTYRIGCLFSIPPAYQPALKPNLNRYADHKDIFPTLYHLALSNVDYPKFGHNLFDALEEKDEYAIVMYNILFAPEGVIHNYTSPRPSPISWSDSIQLYTDFSVPVSAKLVEKGRKARALTALMDWYIRYQVNTLPDIKK